MQQQLSILDEHDDIQLCPSQAHTQLRTQALATDCTVRDHSVSGDLGRAVDDKEAAKLVLWLGLMCGQSRLEVIKES